jgi:hypothetical protein
MIFATYISVFGLHHRSIPGPSEPTSDRTDLFGLRHGMASSGTKRYDRSVIIGTNSSVAKPTGHLVRSHPDPDDYVRQTKQPENGPILVGLNFRFDDHIESTHQQRKYTHKKKNLAMWLIQSSATSLLTNTSSTLFGAAMKLLPGNLFHWSVWSFGSVAAVNGRQHVN